MDLEHLKKLLELGILEDEETANLAMANLLAPGDKFVDELAKQQIEVAYLQQQLSDNLFTKISEEAPGPILVGHDPQGTEQTVGLSPLDLTCVVLIVGTPKSGKTTLI